ncbi:uncharacterized protein LOC119081094 [Bradysia coprophila]|uniref:uncharacterized protein LOC119081094 n=1 Tax=Bradysia coprophila TaxID=38358 RepID=UPI00187DD0EF|nr:uncharacterized protein LOC119081094 [Bradysia coprophila]
MTHASAIWTTKLLHQLADRIQNVIDKTTEDQAVKQIDCAINSATVHPFDPFSSLDLHKMVNDVSGEIGRGERQRFNTPSEMAFVRSKHSQRAASLSRSMVAMLAHSEQTDMEMDRCIELLFAQIDNNIRTLAPRISAAKIKASKLSTQLRDAVEASFTDFLAGAKTAGIEKNMVRKKPSPAFLSRMSMPAVRTGSTNEPDDIPSDVKNVPDDAEPAAKRGKSCSSETLAPLVNDDGRAEGQESEQMSVDTLRDIIKLVSGRQ